MVCVPFGRYRRAVAEVLLYAFGIRSGEHRIDLRRPEFAPVLDGSILGNLGRRDGDRYSDQSLSRHRKSTTPNPFLVLLMIHPSSDIHTCFYNKNCAPSGVRELKTRAHRAYCGNGQGNLQKQHIGERNTVFCIREMRCPAKTASHSRVFR